MGYTRTKVAIRAASRSATPVGRAPEYAHAWKAGAGAFKSNIEDFAKWAAALINGRLVSKSHREGDVDATEDVGREIDGNGPGIFHRRMGREPDDRCIRATNRKRRATSILFLKPRNGIVVLCNCGYGKPAEISKAVATAIGEQ